jgi:hypothetical protein
MRPPVFASLRGHQAAWLRGGCGRGADGTGGVGPGGSVQAAVVCIGLPAGTRPEED